MPGAVCISADCWRAVVRQRTEAEAAAAAEERGGCSGSGSGSCAAWGLDELVVDRSVVAIKGKGACPVVLVHQRTRTTDPHEGFEAWAMAPDDEEESRSQCNSSSRTATPLSRRASIEVSVNVQRQLSNSAHVHMRRFSSGGS